MLCVRCGSSNQNQDRNCRACGAILPRNFGESQSSSLMDLHDGRSYDAPDCSYSNNALDALEEAVDIFFEGRGSSAAIEGCLKELESRLGGLLTCMPDTLLAIQAQKEDDPDDVPHQIGYLVQMGIQFFNNGLDQMREVLSGADHSVDEVLDALRKGNDYICHSAALVSLLFAREGQSVQLEASVETANSDDFEEEPGALA